MSECYLRLSCYRLGFNQALLALNVFSFIRTASFVFKRATWTLYYPSDSTVVCIRIKQDRLSTILVAMWTYLMWWLRSFARFFQSIHLASIPGSYELVVLLCFFPCLNATNFFFKLPYFLNHRELIGLCRKCTGLRVENRILKLYSFCLDIRQRLKTLHSPSDFSHSLDASNCSGDAWCINHRCPSWMTLTFRKNLAMFIQRGQINGPINVPIYLPDLRFVSLLPLTIPQGSQQLRGSDTTWLPT